MPNELVLPINPGQLPVGFCPATYQEQWNGFAAAGSVTFPDTFTGIVVSQTAPTDTTRVWLKVNSLNYPVAYFNYAQGGWVSRHPIPPGVIIMRDDIAAADVPSWDGGDGSLIVTSPTVGPMWTVVAEMAARMPIGIGTLPDSGTPIALTDTGGEDLVELLEANIPEHTHQFANPSKMKELYIAEHPAGETFSVDNGGSIGGKTAGDLTNWGGDASGDTTPHQNMPPYYGMLFIRRSTRLFYVP